MGQARSKIFEPKWSKKSAGIRLANNSRRCARHVPDEFDDEADESASKDRFKSTFWTDVNGATTLRTTSLAKDVPRRRLIEGRADLLLQASCTIRTQH